MPREIKVSPERLWLMSPEDRGAVQLWLKKQGIDASFCAGFRMTNKYAIFDQYVVGEDGNAIMRPDGSFPTHEVHCFLSETPEWFAGL